MKRRSLAALPALDVVPFDGAALERKTYLTTAEAAYYTGYTVENGYRDPAAAFLATVRRLGPSKLPKCAFGVGFARGAKLLFRRRDLDRVLRPATEPVPRGGSL